ncbi:MAG: PASTA domain-containing protein [Microthrixaceae bacterium]|nr:PASTA domain-containing protein [Microthrixaceae bacterium]
MSRDEEVFEVVEPGWRLPAALVVVVLTLALATWAWASELTGRHVAEDLPRIVLPSVADLDVATAELRLSKLGFVVGVELRANETVPRGTAFGQEPVAGAKLELGDRVSILVSDGPAGVVVPSVVGQQVTDAQALLTAEGLGGEVLEVNDDLIRPGEVISSRPGVGARIAQNGTVGLVVSKGPAPRIVPTLVGTDVNSALVAIGRAGLTVGTITRSYEKDRPAGQVMSSSPAAGEPVPREMPVELTVTGPAPTVSLRSFTGLLQETAQAVARASDVQLSIVAKPVPFGDPTLGRVVAQGIPPYSDVPTGTVVEVTVAVLG